MITRDSIEQAYSFFHQKWNVYRGKSNETQKDDIEYAISSYVDSMSPELYAKISNGNPAFLREHSTFREDIAGAVAQMEAMLAGDTI